jgi:hypothetical protein
VFSTGQTIGSGWILGVTPLFGDVLQPPVAGFLSAHGGAQSFYMDSYGSGSLFQTFSATSGTAYTLALFLSGHGANAGAVTALITGGTDSFSQAFAAPDNAAWYEQILGFTPTSSGTYTLTLTSTPGTPMVIDDVSITAAIPEPASAALGLGFMGGIAGWMRRRRKQSAG